jgi:hypothetical protein
MPHFLVAIAAPRAAGRGDCSLHSFAVCLDSAELFYFREFRENLLVGGPDLVVNFREFPTDDSLAVDDVGGRMGPAAAVGIEDAEVIDYPVVLVFEKKKVVVARLARFEPLE